MYYIPIPIILQRNHHMQRMLNELNRMLIIKSPKRKRTLQNVLKFTLKITPYICIAFDNLKPFSNALYTQGWIHPGLWTAN